MLFFYEEKINNAKVKKNLTLHKYSLIDIMEFVLKLLFW